MLWCICILRRTKILYLTSCASLDGLVEVHDENVDCIKQYQDKSFVPLYPFVVDDADQYRDRNSISEAIPRQGPPVQGYFLNTTLYSNNTKGD